MVNNKQQQMKMNINIEDLQTVTCPNCKNSIFGTNLSIFKKLPNIQSPTGKAQLIKIDLISCPACSRFYFIKDTKLIPLPIEGMKNEAPKGEDER